MNPMSMNFDAPGLARVLCLLAAMTLGSAPALAQEPSQAPEPTPIQESAGPFLPTADPFAPRSPENDPFSLGFAPFDAAPLMEDLCRKALAAATCKPATNYNFIQEQDLGQGKGKRRAQDVPQGRVLVFSGFYGAKDAQFFCQVDDRRIIISSEAWGAKRITVPYAVDQAGRCVSASLRMEGCGSGNDLRICEEQQ